MLFDLVLGGDQHLASGGAGCSRCCPARRLLLVVALSAQWRRFSGFALGVDLLVIKSWGLWASLDSLHLYVDVLVAADEAAGLFFGHLLRRFPQAPARA